MKKLLLALTLAVCCHASFAQTTISGTVKSTADSLISYATVVLYSLPDTTQVNYTITDLEGKFSTLVPSTTTENYLLHIAYVGYKPIYVPASDKQTIILEENALQVNEVLIEGSRPISTITQSGGIQTSVENTVLSEMGSANDVLKRIPMLTGDDGTFEVFGRGEAVIYVNNRQVRDASDIETINSKDIANIEVISTPGARYDASVLAVIKITTIKKQGDSFSFNTSSTYKTWGDNNFDKFLNQIKTNYRKGGLDVFANITYNDISNFSKGDLLQSISVDTLWSLESYQNVKLSYNRLNALL
ncbi:MAG: carboxypeptidase regulatory-like domain-containing protein [Rikenellaceae bacterium]